MEPTEALGYLHLSDLTERLTELGAGYQARLCPHRQTDELQNNRLLVGLRRSTEAGRRVRIGKSMDAIHCQAPLLTLLG